MASGVETIRGPVGPVLLPSTTIRQLFNSAPPLAFRGMAASFWPSGMLTPPEAPTPGGTNGTVNAMAALNPSFRLATTFSPIDPPRTSGTLGSTTSML